MNAKNQTPSTKIFQVFAVLLIIYCFIAGFFELPPATLLISYYCQLFNTNEYPASLISLILFFICLIPLGVVKKIIDHKRKT
jgi:hypothetical protein